MFVSVGKTLVAGVAERARPKRRLEFGPAAEVRSATDRKRSIIAATQFGIFIDDASLCWSWEAEHTRIFIRIDRERSICPFGKSHRERTGLDPEAETTTKPNRKAPVQICLIAGTTIEIQL